MNENKTQNKDIRWVQRFENYSKTYSLLAELYDRDIDNLSIYERESYIHRFTLLFDLAWKTLSDYLQFSGIMLELISPRSVIKEAFAAGVIKDGQTFVDMLLARNELTHIYDQKRADKHLFKIKSRYLPSFTKLLNFFKGEMRCG